jgi:hypothetical protein
MIVTLKPCRGKTLVRVWCGRGFVTLMRRVGTDGSFAHGQRLLGRKDDVGLYRGQFGELHRKL